MSSVSDGAADERDCLLFLWIITRDDIIKNQTHRTLYADRKRARRRLRASQATRARDENRTRFSPRCLQILYRLPRRFLRRFIAAKRDQSYIDDDSVVSCAVGGI